MAVVGAEAERQDDDVGVGVGGDGLDDGDGGGDQVFRLGRVVHFGSAETGSHRGRPMPPLLDRAVDLRLAEDMKISQSKQEPGCVQAGDVVADDAGLGATADEDAAF